MTIGVVIADDQALLRTGFRLLIDSEPDMAVLGEATDGVEAVGLAGQTRPDLVLMDVLTPQVDGIEATAAIQPIGADPAAQRIVAETARKQVDAVVATEAIVRIAPGQVLDAIETVALSVATRAGPPARRSSTSRRSPRSMSIRACPCSVIAAWRSDYTQARGGMAAAIASPTPHA